MGEIEWKHVSEVPRLDDDLILSDNELDKRLLLTLNKYEIRSPASDKLPFRCQKSELPSHKRSKKLITLSQFRLASRLLFFFVDQVLGKFLLSSGSGLLLLLHRVFILRAQSDNSHYLIFPTQS